MRCPGRSKVSQSDFFASFMVSFQDKGGNFCVEQSEGPSIPSVSSAFTTPKQSAPSSVALDQSVTPTISIGGSSFQMTPEMMTLLTSLTTGGPTDSSLMEAAYNSPRANVIPGLAPGNTSFGNTWASSPALQASTPTGMNILQQAAMDANIPQQGSPFGNQGWNAPVSAENSQYVQHPFAMGMLQGVPAAPSPGPGLQQPSNTGMVASISGAPLLQQTGMLPAVSGAPLLQQTGMVQPVSSSAVLQQTTGMVPPVSGQPVLQQTTGMLQPVSGPPVVQQTTGMLTAVSGQQSITLSGVLPVSSQSLSAGAVPDVTVTPSHTVSATPGFFGQVSGGQSSTPGIIAANTSSGVVQVQQPSPEKEASTKETQQKDDKAVTTSTRESPANEFMPYAVWKTLVDDKLVIRGIRVDVVFTNLQIIEDLVTEQGVLPGYFVRGLAHKVVNIGGFVKCSAGRMGWRTMEYQKFVDCCNIAERGAQKTKKPSSPESPAEKALDKYVSTPFNDPAYNIEYRNLCAANARDRSEPRCFCRLAGR